MFAKVFQRRNHIYWLSLLISLFLIGCGPGNKGEESDGESAAEETQEEISLEDDITVVDIAKEDFERMLNGLPEPTAVPEILMETGAKYNDALLNPASKAQDYMTTNNKAAINLGVLSADLGYLCVYGKTQEAINYLSSSQKLVEHLGIANAVHTSVMKRFEANLSNQDTLISLANQSVELAKEYLNESERFGNAALIATGSLIEGLYISTGLVENYPKDLPEAERKAHLTGLIKSILDQKQALGDLVNVLSVLGDSDEDVIKTRDQISELFNMYDLIGIQEKMESDPDALLTDETLKGITAKVAEIRADFVN